jgi:hypothetical protein
MDASSIKPDWDVINMMKYRRMFREIDDNLGIMWKNKLDENGFTVFEAIVDFDKVSGQTLFNLIECSK